MMPGIKAHLNTSGTSNIYGTYFHLINFRLTTLPICSPHKCQTAVLTAFQCLALLSTAIYQQARGAQPPLLQTDLPNHFVLRSPCKLLYEC